MRRTALDGVCTRLVHRFVRGDVFLDFGIFQYPENHLGTDGEYHCARGVFYADPGNHLVRGTRKCPEHIPRMGGIVGFPENRFVLHHNGICGDNDSVGGHGMSFFSGQPLSICARLFIR